MMNTNYTRAIPLHADENLLYTIHKTTKEPSIEILAYFSRIMNEIHESLKTSNARWPNRKITAMYPNTSICYTFVMEGTPGRESARLDFAYPKRILLDIKGLATVVAEETLLGNNVSSDINFRKPELKAPRGKKGLLV